MSGATLDLVAHAAARRALYTASPGELAATLASGAERLTAMVAEVRPDTPGAADRAEHLAAQLEGLRQQALRLGAALREASARAFPLK